jgi:putative transposase
MRRMPWKATEPMDQKMLFVRACQGGRMNMSELCEAFGISRKTGYKWLARYQTHGVVGLEELSRAPRTHPNATDDSVVALLTELRRERPRWGPKKLLAYLTPKWPALQFPSESTLSEILRRRGLSNPRGKRRRTAVYSQPFLGYDEPNAVWCIDFKGWFLMRDRKKCHPLTISDGYSRYLLRCHGSLRTDFTIVRFVLLSAFDEYGLPGAIRSDNGPPFATAAPGGVSRFAVMLIRLGIRPERIQPGKPTQNGRHERMHRTLKEETASPPAQNRLAQQRSFDAFRSDYNEVRPHEAIGQVPPSSLYRPSSRSFERWLRDPDYSDDVEPVRVRSDGTMKWLGHHFMLTEVLAGELVGCKRIDDGCWKLSYGPLELGMLNSRGHFRQTNNRRTMLPMCPG